MPRRHNPLFAPVTANWYNAVAWRYRANPGGWTRREVMGVTLWVCSSDPKRVVAKDASRFLVYYAGKRRGKAGSLADAKQKAMRAPSSSTRKTR